VCGVTQSGDDLPSKVMEAPSTLAETTPLPTPSGGVARDSAGGEGLLSAGLGAAGLGFGRAAVGAIRVSGFAVAGLGAGALGFVLGVPGAGGVTRVSPGVTAVGAAIAGSPDGAVAAASGTAGTTAVLGGTGGLGVGTERVEYLQTRKAPATPATSTAAIPNHKARF
jgi:hypothetical protein